MNFKEHKKFGIVSSVLTVPVVYYFSGSIILSMLCGAVCFVGANFCDLDTDSTPSKVAALLLSGVILYTIFQGEINRMLGIEYMLNYKITLWISFVFAYIKSRRHRGITHKYIIPFALIVVGVLFGSFYLCSFSFGIVTHLLVDKILPDRKNIV